MLEVDAEQALLKFFDQLKLTEVQETLIVRYIALLEAANVKCNLIGRKQDRYRLVYHHIIDSLLPLLKPLPKDLSKIFDIGSGAGLPGVLWSIVAPDRKYFLIEKSPKKSLFLSQVIRDLDLNHVTVINKRCEEFTEKADLIISRAMTSCAHLIELCAAMCTEKTQFWLFKALSSSIEQEMEENNINQQWSIVVEPLAHPLQELSRHIVKISSLKSS
jgi:16S rRNA (guanine527-N7)-methyltransferase